MIDPFLGSAVDLIAAQATGRVCRGVELDPLYVDVIVRRYEAATGNHAVLVETGEALDLLAARRSSEPARSTCFVPGFAGASLSNDSKDALWDKFFTGAPQRRSG